MKRAAILQGCIRNEIKHAPRWNAQEWTKLVIFSGFCGGIIGAIWPNLNALATGLLACAGGYISLICWNAWRARDELSEMAFKAWLERAAAIARQYDVDIEDVEAGASCNLIWRRRWRGRLSPDQAVKQELDAREHNYVEPDQPWPRH